MTTDSARHFGESRARVYDDLIRRVVPGYEVLHRLVAVRLAHVLAADARILVVGAGTGAEIAELAPVRPQWRFTGCDPSAEMLDAARQRLERLGARVELVHGGVDALPADPVYDAATLVLVLHFVADDGAKAALLSAVGRRLKPGAPLVLADLHGRPGEAGFDGMMGLWRDWQIDAGVPVAEVDKGFRRIVRDIHFVPEERLAVLLREAGFREMRRFWGALAFGGWTAWKD